MEYDRFQEILQEEAEKIPEKFYEGLNGGVIISEETKLSPYAQNNDLYIAGQYLHTTFEAKNNELILEKDIDLYSVCEHHLLPFYGKAHIAYIPDGRVAGLSKLARTIEVFAKRPQIQEQLTAQTADALMEHLKPKGVMVVIEAEHMCMTMRGVRKPGTKTLTYVCRGVFENNNELINRVLMMVR